MPSKGSPVHMGKADRKPGPEATVPDHRWKSQIMPEIDGTTKLPCLVLFLCLGCCTEEKLPLFKPLNFGVSDSSFTSLNSADTRTFWDSSKQWGSYDGRVVLTSP